MSKKSKESITIHNIKGTNHRQIHVDGASASVTPGGFVNVNFYSERNVIPKSTTFELNENGTLGDVISHSDDSKKGFIREFDFGVFMDVNTCKGIIELLERKIKELEPSK